MLYIAKEGGRCTMHNTNRAIASTDSVLGTEHITSEYFTKNVSLWDTSTLFNELVLDQAFIYQAYISREISVKPTKCVVLFYNHRF